MSDDRSGQGGPAGVPEYSDGPADLAEPEPIDVTPGRWQVDDVRQPPSRRRIVLLASALVAGLAGAAILGTAGWRVAQQKDATLQTPARVAGLTRDDSERARTTADYLRTAFAAGIDVDKSIGAVYADPANAQRSVLLFGGTTLLWSPERDLDTLFDLVSDDSGAVIGLHEVSAGGLGGVMKCGTTASQDGEIPVCGWADHGSVAIAMFPGRTTKESAGLLVQIRDEVQKRN